MKCGYDSCQKYAIYHSSSLYQLKLITYTVINSLNQDLTHTLNFQDFISTNYRHSA